MLIFPYISEIAFTFLDLNRKILPPQHIVVNLASDYPVTEKEYVPSIAFEPKYADFQADSITKIETCSMQEYICQSLNQRFYLHDLIPLLLTGNERYLQQNSKLQKST